MPALCAALAAAVLLAFGRTVRYDFVNYDDDAYVYDNPQVSKGLTVDGLIWAFRYSEIGHWHPLTWVSHMLDVQFYGLNPGGHHTTNVLLHAATAVALFLVLRKMSGAVWRSAFVAAVFAVHPLRAESVAWISERKDVLSAFFFMLTLAAYLFYVRKPSLSRYAVVMALFALGLLSKNMLVTLPFVLLLLDYWPLNRWPPTTAAPKTNLARLGLRPLFLEKLPLLALSFGSCLATGLATEKITPGFVAQPFLPRLENALVSYIVYIRQMVVPLGLAIPYPVPEGGFPLWQPILAALVLTLVSIWAYACRRKHPACLVGWLWYLGMAFPVIGLVQISYYAHADRYTYLPQIGLCIALTWGITRLTASWRYQRQLLGTVCALVLAALAGLAALQTSCWRDSVSLWTHSLACIPNSKVAQVDLKLSLGHLSESQGKIDDAIQHYQSALEIMPFLAPPRYYLGGLLWQKNHYDEALDELQRTIQLSPDYSQAHCRLADLLVALGRHAEGADHYARALEIKPTAEVRFKLALALQRQNKFGPAIAEYRRVLALEPDNPATHINLALLLAACPETSLRDTAEALRLAQRAQRLLGGDQPQVLDTLALAYAQAGRLSEAVQTAARGIRLAEAEKNNPLAESFRERLGLYQRAVSNQAISK